MFEKLESESPTKTDTSASPALDRKVHSLSTELLYQDSRVKAIEFENNALLGEVAELKEKHINQKSLFTKLEYEYSNLMDSHIALIKRVQTLEERSVSKVCDESSDTPIITLRLPTTIQLVVEPDTDTNVEESWEEKAHPTLHDLPVLTREQSPLKMSKLGDTGTFSSPLKREVGTWIANSYPVSRDQGNQLKKRSFFSQTNKTSGEQRKITTIGKNLRDSFLNSRGTFPTYEEFSRGANEREKSTLKEVPIGLRGDEEKENLLSQRDRSRYSPFHPGTKEAA